MPRCPGCGAILIDPADCDRCEYFNLASGRYHYCGEASCYCSRLPGLSLMRPEVRARFEAEHEARIRA